MATERLIVKNFGPIQEADLDLRKVTVLIGEQASGKSVLAKLFTILNHLDFFSERKPFVEFTKRYSIDFQKNETQIRYKAQDYSVEITNEKPIFHFDGAFKKLVEAQKKLMPWLDKYLAGEKVDLPNGQALEEVLKVQQTARATSVYILAERQQIILISESPFAFIESKIALPEYIVSSGTYLDFAKRDVKNIEVPTLDFALKISNGRLIIKYKGAETFLFESSTGLQSLAPLVLLIEHFTSPRSSEGKSPVNFIIEEPELNLYPTAQKKLVEYLIEKCTKGDNRLIITTHSPYILTTLNNCIEANNVLKSNPETKEKVDKLVPPESQIAYEDVAAYFVANGSAKSIMNEKYQIIDANALDDVSEELARVFDSLLDLKYQTQD